MDELIKIGKWFVIGKEKGNANYCGNLCCSVVNMIYYVERVIVVPW